MHKKALDLSHLRPIVGGLQSDGIISKDETDALIQHLGGMDHVTPENLEEASRITSEPDQVLDRLLQTIRSDVGKMEPLVPGQPSVEPQPSADLVNNALSVK